MLKTEMTNIYSIEGKDLYKKVLKINEFKKFKATFDYSLEAIQIEKVSKEVYRSKKETVFYQNNKGKQFTNKIINLTFKYNVKEYNPIMLKGRDYYIHHESSIDNKILSELIFENGVHRKDDSSIDIIELGAKTNLATKDLPSGFKVEDQKICLTTSGSITIATADEIRKELYEHGFKIHYENEEIEYVRFKRSSGSSRVGKCLFIDKRLYPKMLEWSMMGLKFKDIDKIDLAAFEAYISLTTSSIIDTIHIEPKNILLIDDYESSFKDRVMVTKIIKQKHINEDGEEIERDRLFTEPDAINIKNSIWDGESLLDSSLFSNSYINKLQDGSLLMNNKKFMLKCFGIEIDKYINKGFFLLRNRFFKSACFNCNIQKFFQDNNIIDISQLNGFTLADKIEDVKVITTPSSIKYLKFGKIEDYLNQLESTFGIVKYDKPTHHFDGEMVQTHYQLLNTLQLGRNEIKELLKPSKDYIDLLKNDNRVLRDYLKMKIKDKVECGDINSTEDLIFTLLTLNEDFYNTDLCTNFKSDLIDSYLKNMKKSHILVNGNYSVLCGNGIEMLKATIKDEQHSTSFKEESLLNIDEVYCKNFKPERNLICSRSPHITMSNIWLCKNTSGKKADLIDKYFNSSNQIIHINSIGTNILERLSGADFDSDQVMITDNELLIKSASKNYNNFLVSTSAVKAQKVSRLNNAEQKCDLDIKTSKNLIGEIVNCSAYLNSQLWNRIYQGEKISSDGIQLLYRMISQLNIMSCIEIDKAKKEFSIDNELELEEIRSNWCSNKKPLFFKQLAKERIDKENEKNKKNDKDKPKEIRRKKKIVNENKFQFFNCSLDYLIQELSDIKRMKNREDAPTICNILVKDDLKLNDADRKQIDNIILKCIKTKNECSAIWRNDKKENEEKYIETNSKKEELIEYIKKLSIKIETIKKILYDLNKEQINKKNEKKIKDIETKITKLSENKNEDNDKSKDKINKLIKELKKIQNNTKVNCQYRIIPIQRILLTTLYNTNREQFRSLFKESKTKINTIKKLEDEDIEKTIEIIKIYNMDYIVI